MFVVETPDGPKYMVQLTGPKSWRRGGIYVTRGATITVTKRTRDYLVKGTGYFSDFDPTIEDPVEEVLPAQFGGDLGPSIDPDDIENLTNQKALTQDQAMGVAMQNSGYFVDQHGRKIAEPTTEELAEVAARMGKHPEEGSGDLSSADLKEGQKASGGNGKAAQKATPVKAQAKKAPANVTIEKDTGPHVGAQTIE